mgnify:FL=1
MSGETPDTTTEVERTQQGAKVLSSLLEVGRKLYAYEDTQEMLETILTHARKLTGAEAGSMFLANRDQLKFGAVQNDLIDTSNIAQNLLGRTMPARPRGHG